MGKHTSETVNMRSIRLFSTAWLRALCSLTSHNSLTSVPGKQHNSYTIGSPRHASPPLRRRLAHPSTSYRIEAKTLGDRRGGAGTIPHRERRPLPDPERPCRASSVRDTPVDPFCAVREESDGLGSLALTVLCLAEQIAHCILSNYQLLACSFCALPLSSLRMD